METTTSSRLPYGARSVEEMERNQARLGEAWQEIPRTWDERLGYVQRPMPLLPVFATIGIIGLVVGACVLLTRLGY
jgi:hypothetical protein